MRLSVWKRSSASGRLLAPTIIIFSESRSDYRDQPARDVRTEKIKTINIIFCLAKSTALPLWRLTKESNKTTVLIVTGEPSDGGFGDGAR
jgi:hypothetical protein